jgi:DNA mismatch repair protein MutS
VGTVIDSFFWRAAVSSQGSSTSATPEQGFRSILFPAPAGSVLDGDWLSRMFVDLNLDKVIDAITKGRDEYNLKPFFNLPLHDVAAINYRQAVLRDIESPVLMNAIVSFAETMRKMRTGLATGNKLYYKRQKQSFFVDAMEKYCDAVENLSNALMHSEIRSEGLGAFNTWLLLYSASEGFSTLRTDGQKLKAALRETRYFLRIRGKAITVLPYGSEPDYGADVLHTFYKFRQGATKAYRFDSNSSIEMNHVEAAVLDLVAKLYPGTFTFLDDFYENHQNFLDPIIADFDREIQFYVAYLEHTARFKQAGLSFCYPVVSDRSKEIGARHAFDVALAATLLGTHSPIVTNDFHLKDPERVLVVTGPNQGGKTTFARTFGQLHYLAALGCPVPGTDAKLFLFDRIFTHFEKAEDSTSLSGKLEEELERMKAILDYATSDSILIMNESFLSTTAADSLFLSEQIMQKITELDALCVTVTFLDEMASFGKSTVSMVCAVDANRADLRTFKIIRKPADGLAYANAIAEKYRLTRSALRARIERIPAEQAAQ